MVSDILIVDDEADIRELVSGILSDEGHGTRTASDSDSALAEIAKRVGIKPPSIYAHYDCLDDILSAVARRGLLAMLATLTVCQRR